MMYKGVVMPSRHSTTDLQSSSLTNFFLWIAPSWNFLSRTAGNLFCTARSSQIFSN